MRLTTVSFSAPLFESVPKACFYKAYLSTASESEFYHANKILRLKVAAWTLAHKGPGLYVITVNDTVGVISLIRNDYGGYNPCNARSWQ